MGKLTKLWNSVISSKLGVPHSIKWIPHKLLQRWRSQNSLPLLWKISWTTPRSCPCRVSGGWRIVWRIHHGNERSTRSTLDPAILRFLTVDGTLQTSLVEDQDCLIDREHARKKSPYKRCGALLKETLLQQPQGRIQWDLRQDSQCPGAALPQEHIQSD